MDGTLCTLDYFWVNTRASARRVILRLAETYSGKILAVSLIPHHTYWLPFYTGPPMQVPGVDMTPPRTQDELLRIEGDGMTQGYELMINYCDPSCRSDVRTFLASLSGTPGFEWDDFSQCMNRDQTRLKTSK